MVRGYKVFNSDWTCRNKQYTCPGVFEEEGKLSLCGHGMHFCPKLIDCFSYYPFNPQNKVAEVIAYNEIIHGTDKCCTNKLEIVRELSWAEVLSLINTGVGCTGMCNNGDNNSGSYNNGNSNSGLCNNGDYNSGNHNIGDFNGGNCNNGNANSGHYNNGVGNSGNFNSGDFNSGDYNNGICNSGDFNNCSYSNGIFNTISPKIFIFDKPSEWTLNDWSKSKACRILRGMPLKNGIYYISFENMSDEEKLLHSEAEITGGYLKVVNDPAATTEWWQSLSDEERAEVMSIPNFDKEIFKEITGIDVDWKEVNENE